MYAVLALSSKSRGLGEEGACYIDQGIGNGSDGLAFSPGSGFPLHTDESVTVLVRSVVDEARGYLDQAGHF